jgi:hypothetical protein
MDRVEEIADGPKKQDDWDVQERVCPVYEPPHGKALKQISSDTPRLVWSRPGISGFQVFIAPLLDKSTWYRTYDAQEKAEEQHDIDANGSTWRIVAGEERLVYFNDE